MHKHICRNWLSLQSFFGETLWKSCCNPKPFTLKQLQLSLFGQTLFLECESHTCCFSEQYTILNCIYRQFAMQSTSHTHSISLVSTISDFWTHRFQATIISTFWVHWFQTFTVWLKICWKTLCGVSKVKWNIVLLI